MRLFFLLSLALFTVSCNSAYNFDKQSVALVPVENIQFIFERSHSAKELFFISEKRGNTLVLSEVKSALNFVKNNEKELILDDNLVFIWDTLTVVKKLFLIDTRKAFIITPTNINTVQTDDDNKAQELMLNPQKNQQLSLFFAKHIGKELIAVDKNGFVAGVNQLGKSDDGHLLIKEITKAK